MTKTGYYLGDAESDDGDSKLTKKQRKALKQAKRANNGLPTTRGAALINNDESENESSSEDEKAVKVTYNIGNAPN